MTPEELQRIEKLATQIENPSRPVATSYMDTPQEHPLTYDKTIYEENLPEGITPEMVQKLRDFDEEFKAAFVLACGRDVIKGYVPGQHEYVPRNMYEIQTTTDNFVVHFHDNEKDTGVRTLDAEFGTLSAIPRLNKPAPNLKAEQTALMIKQLFEAASA